MNLYESINKGFEAKYGKIEDAQISKQAPKSRKAIKESLAAKLWTVDDYIDEFGPDAEDMFYFRQEMEAGGAGRDMLSDTEPECIKALFRSYPNWDAVKIIPETFQLYEKGKIVASCKLSKSYYAQESLTAKRLGKSISPQMKEAREDHFPIKKYLADNKDTVDQIVSSAQTRGWRAANQALIDFIKEAPEIPEGQKKAFEAKMSAIRNATGFFSAVATYMTAIKVYVGAKVKTESCDKKPVSERMSRKKKAIKESRRSYGTKNKINEAAGFPKYFLAFDHFEPDTLFTIKVNDEKQLKALEGWISWYIEDITDRRGFYLIGHSDDAFYLNKLSVSDKKDLKKLMVDELKQQIKEDEEFFDYPETHLDCIDEDVSLDLDLSEDDDEAAVQIADNWFESIDDSYVDGDSGFEFRFVTMEEEKKNASDLSEFDFEDDEEDDEDFDESFKSRKSARKAVKESLRSRKALKESKQKLIESSVEIYLDDLKDDKKAEILEILGGDAQNYDVFPLTTFEVDEEAMKEALAKKKALKECDCPDCQCDGACTCTEDHDCCGGEVKSRRAMKRHAMEENLGQDIDQYQKWVDYDMKKYGRISDITNRELKKAGLKIVKDKYGDYEVMV